MEDKATKKIKIKNEIKEMSLEEVLECFNDMSYKFAIKCENNLKQYSSNSYYALEDYLQIARLQITNCYSKYDMALNNCFSTFLTVSLRNKFLVLAKSANRLKRKNLNAVSLDTTYIYPNTLQVQDDYLKEEEDLSLENFLIENLTEDEIIYFKIDLLKKKSKSSKLIYNCIDYVLENFVSDIKLCFKNKKDLAQALNISRPTLNTRINQTRQKVEFLMNNYMSCR